MSPLVSDVGTESKLNHAFNTFKLTESNIMINILDNAHVGFELFSVQDKYYFGCSFKYLYPVVLNYLTHNVKKDFSSFRQD